MRRNRAMLIGAVGAGKTTMTNALLNRKTEPVKTQTLHYDNWIIDTPGEYTENPMFYKSILVTALEVTHVLFLQDATRPKMIFPPGFSTGVSKLIIGVVTKADEKNADVDLAIRQLKGAIVRGPIITTSAKKNLGIQELRDLINCNSLSEIKGYIESSKESELFYY